MEAACHSMVLYTVGRVGCPGTLTKIQSIPVQGSALSRLASMHPIQQTVEVFGVWMSTTVTLVSESKDDDQCSKRFGSMTLEEEPVMCSETIE